MKSIEAVKKIYESHISPHVPKNIEATAILQALGFLKIPLLFYTRPKVLELNDRRAIIKIPLKRVTKNHLGTMYFGALAIGADAVVGILAVHFMRKFPDANIHLSFKDFNANFHKRPDSDVHFICDDGEAMDNFVKKVATSNERLSLTVPARAVLPKNNDEEVATFKLTLSLKNKS